MFHFPLFWEIFKSLSLFSLERGKETQNFSNGFPPKTRSSSLYIALHPQWYRQRIWNWILTAFEFDIWSNNCFTLDILKRFSNLKFWEIRHLDSASGFLVCVCIWIEVWKLLLSSSSSQWILQKRYTSSSYLCFFTILTVIWCLV